MSSIAQICQILRTLFEEEAVLLARRAGLRQRTIPLARLAYLFVLGWWHRPGAGPSALARFAGGLGLDICKQDVDAHFNERTALWLLAVLRRAVQVVVCSQPVSLPLLQQFRKVLFEDGSTIPLPAVFKDLWRGCGGSRASKPSEAKTEAALKITVRWDLLAGQLEGPYLQEGRQHELTSVLREQEMPAGSLWIADLGYWTLIWLRSLSRQGVYFLLRYKIGIVLWYQKQRLNLLDVLPQQIGQRMELCVDVGADKALKAVRLLAERVPDEVVKQRHARYHEYLRVHCKPPNPLVLEMAKWTIVVTSVPASMLTCEQAFALLRARWQIELLFKLWKQDGLLDEWNGSKPWRILCEVYAKLLAMVVQHWFVLLSCWDDPHRSLFSVAEVLRSQVPTLAHGLCGHLPLRTAVRLLLDSVRGGCSIPARSTRPSTSRLLDGAPLWGLT
jgi:Transposase DDE domain